MGALPAALSAWAPLAAAADPVELVRRAIETDELRASDPAFEYKFVEHYAVRDLAKDGQVKAVRTRTRPVPMTDFVRRRERFRKPLREIPDAFQFSLAGEDVVYARPCFVVEAAPKPGYEPVDRYSKLYTQVRGRLWIDKQTGRWTKLEAELLDTVTFGWILVRIHEGARVRMTQRLVDGHAWLPAELWYRVSLRIGLVSLRYQDSDTIYDGYTRGEPPLSPSSPGASSRRFQPAFAFAQSTRRLTPGKYSLRISSPGMPKIQP
jgi:hypothetical protein